MDPSPFTLRELDMMATGKMRSDWAIASSVMATIVNVNCAKKSDMVSPADFNPFFKKGGRKKITGKAGWNLLKTIVTSGKFK